MFGGSWESGTATIVERHVVREGEFGHTSQYKFVADVEVPGKQPFRTGMRSPRTLPDKFLAPQVGQVVPVKVNVKRQKAKFDRGEPNARNLAPVLQKYANERQAAPPASQADVRAVQLKEIASLKEQGRLTEAEYERAREFIEGL